MFDDNDNSVMTNIEKMRKEILDLDTRYSTTKSFLNSIETVEKSVDELYKRRNTGVRTKGNWVVEEDGITYCSCCGAPKIQTYVSFCGNCGADMGKL